MTNQITYKTEDVETASGVAHKTEEIPKVQTDPVNRITTFIFYGLDAPEAAKQFRINPEIQGFLSAKKTVLRLLRGERGR
jgi:hypothetical protein